MRERGYWRVGGDGTRLKGVQSVDRGICFAPFLHRAFSWALWQTHTETMETYVGTRSDSQKR